MSTPTEVETAPNLSVTEMMTDLPPIRPQEMKIIGRCVHFRCDKPPKEDDDGSLASQQDRERYFVGMVSYITKDTVVLLDCCSYNREAELERRRNLSTDDKKREESQRKGLRAEEGNDGDAAEGSTTTAPDASASPQPPGTSGETKVAVDEPKVMPYVTFNRKKIRNVEFSPENHKLSAQPKTAVPNEQRLRMFVRRYIVHTSVNNNPNGISLKEFISMRCKWKNPDVEVLQTMAEDEMAVLKRIDEEIMKHREARNAARAAQMAAAGMDAGGRGAPGRGGTNPYADESLLYQTGIPAKTSYTAVAHLALSITLLLYSAASFSGAEQYVVFDFVSPLSPFVAVAGAINLFLGGATGYHALKMKLPVNLKPLFLRLMFLFVSTGFMLSVAVMASMTLYGDKQPTESMTLKKFYTNQVTQKPVSVCNYNQKYRCSGFDTACGSVATSQCPVCALNSPFATPCENSIKENIRDTLLPVCIMMYIALLIHLVDWMMFFKMLNKASDLTDAANAEAGGATGREPV